MKALSYREHQKNDSETRVVAKPIFKAPAAGVFGICLGENRTAFDETGTNKSKNIVRNRLTGSATILSFIKAYSKDRRELGGCIVDETAASENFQRGYSRHFLRLVAAAHRHENSHMQVNEKADQGGAMVDGGKLGAGWR